MIYSPNSIQFTTMFRGIEVNVEANNFGEDESVGVPFGPDEITVKTKEGVELDLYPYREEYFNLVDKAIKLWWESEENKFWEHELEDEYNIESDI